jgi:cell division protease FtsH
MYENQQIYIDNGAFLPKGVLLYGEPGVGKTQIAKSFIKATKRNGFEVSLSNISTEQHINQVVSEVFKKAKEIGNAIVLIDDLDLMLPDREYGRHYSNIELKQLLNEIDECQKNDVIVFAAINEISTIDDALIRSGRFDRKIKIDLPNPSDRMAIIEHYLSSTKIEIDKNLKTQMVKSTNYRSGSDIKEIVNDMIIQAVFQEKQKMTRDMFESAYDRVTFKDINKTTNTKKDELDRVAYHEIGHAIMMILLRKEGFDKVTLTKKSDTYGHVRKTDNLEGISTKKDLEIDIMVGLAGYYTEELIYDNPSSLAANDLKTVNGIVNLYIKKYGFSTIELIDNDDSIFATNSSEKRKQEYEKHKALLINRLSKKVKVMLKDNIDLINHYKIELMKTKTLYNEDFSLIST